MGPGAAPRRATRRPGSRPERPAGRTAELRCTPTDTPRYQGRIWELWRRQPRACPAARSSAWRRGRPWPPEPPGLAGCAPGRRRQHRQDRRRAATSRARQLRAQRCAHPQRHRHQLDDAAGRGDRFRPGMGLRRGGLRPRLRRHHRLPASWPSRARRSSSSRSSPRTPTRPWATSSPR